MMETSKYNATKEDEELWRTHFCVPRRDSFRRLISDRATALIETAITLPVLLLLMLNGVNFGLYIFGWVTMSNAARAAVEYQAYNGVAVGVPSGPAFSDISSLFTTDVSSLPNKASAKLRVCSNTNGSISCSTWNGPLAGSYSAPADPQPSQYTIYYADVEYTYQPLFSAFNFPSLQISLTIPPTTIHQQAAMRSMQ
jgi:hypothetical protein